MTLDELTPWLFARTTGGIRWGLERTERLLAGVDDPHRHFRSVLIGGTNGKGSVAALAESALRSAGGRRVGLYTSPHLVRFAERVRVDGKPVGDEVLVEAAERLRSEIEASGASFFEATTAIAFLVLAEAGVDVAVVEVGLGGRLDATNVLSPMLSAVTNVAVDHAEFLGGDVAGIAREKAGIFKLGVPAITGASRSEPEVFAVLSECAAAVGAPFYAVEDLAGMSGIDTNQEGTRARIDSRRWGRRELRVPFPGAHQAANALLAAELLGLLPDDLRPDWHDIERGFDSAVWPGRLQVERVRGTTWLLDVAHNPAGVAALAAALDTLDLPEPRVLVLGVLSDKAWEEMLPPLLARVDAAILTTPPSAPPMRRWDPEAAAAAADRATGFTPRVVPDLADALDRATTLAPHGTVIVTGSIHTVGDTMVHLGLSAG